MIYPKHPIRSLVTSMLRKANIFKRGCEEIRDRKLLEILKKDRTWSLSLITGNKLKKTHSQGIMKKKRTKPTKEF